MTLYGSTPDPEPDLDPSDPVIPHQRTAADDLVAPMATPAGEPAADAGRAIESGSWAFSAPHAAPVSPAPAFDDPVAQVNPAHAARVSPSPEFGATAAPSPTATPAPATGWGAPVSAETTASATATSVVSVDDIVVPDTDPEIAPWDRKPLMVVVAGAVALVMLGVLSGVATANMFPGRPGAWQAAAPTGPAPTSAPVVPPPPPVAETITLSGVGDVIMGTSPDSLPPNGGAGFFDEVKAVLAADLVMGNLDQPITENTGRVKCAEGSTGCHQFYLPPSYANHLRDGGFQVLSLANNHTHDMGMDGLRNTRAALDSVGIEHTGAVDQITTVDVKGINVAVLGFSVYSWGQNLNNIDAAQELVRNADAEADLVVIQMQGGAEGSDKSHVRTGTEMFLGENRGDLMKFSRAVIDAGADVVIGHGPHIMRGMEFYKGRLIAYSLGNFCGYKVLNSNGFLGVGGVLKVTLTKDGTWAGGQLIATEMVRSGYPAPDPDKRALAFVQGLSQEDFGAAAAVISPADGTITPPLTP